METKIEKQLPDIKIKTEVVGDECASIPESISDNFPLENLTNNIKLEEGCAPNVININTLKKSSEKKGHDSNCISLKRRKSREDESAWNNDLERLKSAKMPRTCHSDKYLEDSTVVNPESEKPNVQNDYQCPKCPFLTRQKADLRGHFINHLLGANNTSKWNDTVKIERETTSPPVIDNYNEHDKSTWQNTDKSSQSIHGCQPIDTHSDKCRKDIQIYSETHMNERIVKSAPTKTHKKSEKDKPVIGDPSGLCVIHDAIGNTWFMCTAPGCPFKTNKQIVLKRHWTNHTIKGPFRCQFCSFRCKSQGTLTTHLLQHIEAQNDPGTPMHKQSIPVGLNREINNSDNSEDEIKAVILKKELGDLGNKNKRKKPRLIKKNIHKSSDNCKDNRFAILNDTVKPCNVPNEEESCDNKVVKESNHTITITITTSKNCNDTASIETALVDEILKTFNVTNKQRESTVATNNDNLNLLTTEAVSDIMESFDVTNEEEEGLCDLDEGKSSLKTPVVSDRLLFNVCNKENESSNLSEVQNKEDTSENCINEIINSVEALDVEKSLGISNNENKEHCEENPELQNTYIDSNEEHYSCALDKDVNTELNKDDPHISDKKEEYCEGRDEELRVAENLELKNSIEETVVDVNILKSFGATNAEEEVCAAVSNKKNDKLNNNNNPQNSNDGIILVVAGNIVKPFDIPDKKEYSCELSNDDKGQNKDLELQNNIEATVVDSLGASNKEKGFCEINRGDNGTNTTLNRDDRPRTYSIGIKKRKPAGNMVKPLDIPDKKKDSRELSNDDKGQNDNLKLQKNIEETDVASFGASNKENGVCGIKRDDKEIITRLNRDDNPRTYSNGIKRKKSIGNSITPLAISADSNNLKSLNSFNESDEVLTETEVLTAVIDVSNEDNISCNISDDETGVNEIMNYEYYSGSHNYYDDVSVIKPANIADSSTALVFEEESCYLTDDSKIDGILEEDSNQETNNCIDGELIRLVIVDNGIEKLFEVSSKELLFENNSTIIKTTDEIPVDGEYQLFAENPSVPGSTQDECKCTLKTNNILHLKEHLVSEHSTVLLKCQLCTYSCMSPSDLSQHELRHVGEHNDKGISTSWNEVPGQENALKEEESSCEPVDDTVQQLVGGASEMLTSSSKPIIINYPKVEQMTDSYKNDSFKCTHCPAELPHQRAFTFHLKHHFKTGGIKCCLCTFRSNKTDLLKHLSLHVNHCDGVFRCFLCDIEKRNKENMDDHLKVVHSRAIFHEHNSMCQKSTCNGRC